MSQLNAYQEVATVAVGSNSFVYDALQDMGNILLPLHGKYLRSKILVFTESAHWADSV